MTEKKYWYGLTAILLFILIIILISILPLKNSNNTFNSPDEAGYYRVVKEFGLNNKMYFENEFLEYDKGNNLHQRGFITLDKKVVPFNFLGIPLFYGVLYSFFGDSVKFINIFLFLIFILYLFKLSLIISNKSINIVYILLGVLFATPIIYYFNQPYMNVIPATVFFIIFLFYLIIFNLKRNFVFLWLSLIFSLISIWFRYEYVIFVFLIFLFNFIKNKYIYLNQSKKYLKIVILIITFILIFLIPLLSLNNTLYGSPFTYGYSIFNKVTFQEERSGTFLKSLINVIFPSQNFNFILFFKNLLFAFIIIFPLPAILLYFWFFKKGIKLNLGIYWIIIFYFVIYMGMGNVWGSENALEGGIDKSVVRYWLILYVMLAVYMAIFLKSINKNNIKLLLIVFIIIYSITFIVSSDNGLAHLSSRIDRYDYNIEELKSIVSNNDYLITGASDKYHYKNVNIITWWGNSREDESDKFFSASSIANLTKIILVKNKKVYFIEDGITTNYIPLLENESLVLTPKEGYKGLYEVSLNNETLT